MPIFKVPVTMLVEAIDMDEAERFVSMWEEDPPTESLPEGTFEVKTSAITEDMDHDDLSYDDDDDLELVVGSDDEEF